MVTDLNYLMPSTQEDFIVPTCSLDVTQVCGPKETISGTFFKYSE